MNDVTKDFIDIPEIFKIFGNDSNILLFSNCTNFKKIMTIFKLYNLKQQKNTGLIEVLHLWSDFYETYF
jgi:hypothetical protein